MNTQKEIIELSVMVLYLPTQVFISIYGHFQLLIANQTEPG